MFERKYGINGMVCPYTKYSAEKVKEIKDLLKSLRPKVEAEFLGLDHDKELYAGHRFKDDEMIIWRMASAIKENDLPTDLTPVIREALLDAADSDFYYHFEKDWG